MTANPLSKPLWTTLNIWTACVIFAAAFLYYAHQPINHDTAWFMYAARGMLSGGTLYKDYIDVNAPLAYLMLVPAAALSEFSFISNEAALTLNILAYVLVAWLLAAAVMRNLGLTARGLLATRAALLFVMCFLPQYAFGQREHVFAILIIPYAMAAALRFSNKPLPVWLAVACGIAAGFAVSIKLPYAIVPAFVEATVLLRRRSWYIVFTPDLMALIATTVAINLICYALYPVYWTDILPSAAALYGPYDNAWFLADALLLMVPLFGAGLFAGEYRGRRPLIGARLMLVAATLGAFALFILQRKGWPHHALPIVLLANALFVFNMADLDMQRVARKLNALMRAGVTLCAMAFAFYLAFTTGNVDPNMQAEVEARLKQTDGSFYIMSTGNYPAFPLALNRSYRWTSRFPQLILLPGLIEADARGVKSPYEAPFRTAIREDLERGKPATVFVYMPVDAGGIPGPDMINWFTHDPAFAREWQNYQYMGDAPPFAVFGRVTKG